jgi:hypothetical protein
MQNAWGEDEYIQDFGGHRYQTESKTWILCSRHFVALHFTVAMKL